MFWNVTQTLLGGLVVTFEIFIWTLVFSLPLGLVLALGSMTKIKPLKWLIDIFVWIIRGTPLMLQLIIIFYGPGLWLGTNVWGGSGASRITATVVAFTINYACYFSVIFRGGIQGVPAGQREAGEVLGMTKSQIFFKVNIFYNLSIYYVSLANCLSMEDFFTSKATGRPWGHVRITLPPSLSGTTKSLSQIHLM